MPTYDYLCDACGHRFEQFQSITATALRKCPACGKAKLRRLIGVGAAVLFKGGGFYETDYRSESYRKAEEAERGAATAKPATTSADAAAAGASGASATSEKSAGSAAPMPTPSSATTPTSTSTAASTTPAAPPPAAAKRSGKSHAREGRGVGNLRSASARPPKAAKAAKAAPPPRRGGGTGRRGR